MSSSSSGPVVQASELSQYASCARAWWLAPIKEIPSAHHGEMATGRAVRSHLVETRRTQGLWVAALAAAAVGTCLWWLNS